MKFFNYIKKTFSSNGCEEGEQLSREPLKRSDDYCIRYDKWLKQHKYQDMLKVVHEASTKRTSCCSKRDKSICFLMIPTINGFTMHYDADRWEEQDFRFLFEYIARLLIEKHAYKKFSSMKEVIKYADRVETVERYKLKASDETAAYSDVLLRLCFVNNKMTSLKFCATCAKNIVPNFTDFLNELIMNEKS